MLIHDICRYHALKSPSREAIVFESGERQTWSELENTAERIAATLVNLGVRKGDRVGCLAKNCMEAAQIYFATNKIGAIYAPVNYRFAVPEILRVIADSKPKIFITHAEFLATRDALRQSEEASCVRSWPLVGDGGAPADHLERLMQAAPARGYFPEIGDDDPSWTCYTGGTTGRSKGVLLSHKNMMAGAVNFIITGGIRPHDVYFVAGALFHIALAVPIAYWLAGAKVVLANFEPARSLDLISREGVTHMLCTGTIFKMTVDEMEARPKSTKIKLIYCGGAPVPPQLVRRAQKLFSCDVAQIYGQTEVTLMATYLYPEDYARALAAKPGTAEAKLTASVGRAAPMCVVRVLDKDWQTMPTGQVGEIAVCGDAVMLEYANMPELTAATVRDGWLRTGDLGYMDDDGYVFLVDRAKDMIITGGENVYSSEVELVLAQHPAVTEAVVVGMPDSHWGEAVVALVVCAPGKTPDPEELRAFCRQHLAGYKIPKRIEFRDAFPRLPTGKVAKGELREPFWVGHEKRIHGG